MNDKSVVIPSPSAFAPALFPTTVFSQNNPFAYAPLNASLPTNTLHRALLPPAVIRFLPA